eukprot:scaffold565402_cov50-Prasinocladus_malaysianus.AAC.1
MPQTAGLACRRAISSTIHSLRRLASVVRDIFTPADYVGFIGSLLQAVCLRVSTELLDKRDFSIEESEELPTILSSLVEEAPAEILGLGARLRTSPSEPTPCATTTCRCL